MTEVKVTQADRKAAAELCRKLHVGKLLAPEGERQAADILIGKHDKKAFVQAFARHRQAAHEAGVKAGLDMAASEISVSDRGHNRQCGCADCCMNHAAQSIRALNPADIGEVG
jgi:hypothetical protein